jgi:hypothetical protein
LCFGCRSGRLRSAGARSSAVAESSVLQLRPRSAALASERRGCPAMRAAARASTLGIEVPWASKYSLDSCCSATTRNYREPCGCASVALCSCSHFSADSDLAA